MDQCFVCFEDCSNSYCFLVNLTSKKFKTKYTALIGELINPEYELRVDSENKICERCSVILEKYDELQHETKTIKSVLARQIAHTYGIDTAESMIFLDKSKCFVELGPKANNTETTYSCKLCHSFVTDSLDTVNSHLIYHKIVTQDQMKTNEMLRDLSSNKSNRNQPIHKPREALESPETPKQTVQKYFSKSKPSPQADKVQELKKKKIELELAPVKHEPDLDISSVHIQQAGWEKEYNEETLESLIDLDLLEDTLYDSNLRNNICMVTSCPQKFTYVADYIRHLKLKHKSTLNHIFAVVRANIKRPGKMSKFMCPYCYTKTSSSESLEAHVKHHEEAGKSNLFTDRLNDFVLSVMRNARCKICDCEILDTTVLDCNHEIAKNGMAPKVNCIYCAKEFYSDKLLHNHLALDHNHCFICDNQMCDDKIVLRDHIRSHATHAEYSCIFCSNIYQTKNDRLEHLKITHPEYCCSYCDEWNHELGELEHHVRYAHADKRMEEQKTCICDDCGASFKNKRLFTNHQKVEHQKRKIYTCAKCRETFRFRYALMDHVGNVHQRTVVDNETPFYKCFICMQGFLCKERRNFIQHMREHKTSDSFCSDCNSNLESSHHLVAHRERSHQDFSMLVDKKPYSKNQANCTQAIVRDAVKIEMKSPAKRSTITKTKAQPEAKQLKASTIVDVNNQMQYQIQELEDTDQFKEENDSQQIVITEDGSLLNMNNFILTENGELIIQNLEGLLPNGQESSEDGQSEQIHISNLEQFLMEQGLSGSTEVSYIQQPDEGQMIIQNDDGTMSQSSQESLMQTYKEIFEPDDDIHTELIATSEIPEGSITQNMLLNGDFLVQSIPGFEQSSGQVAEQVEIRNTIRVDANQSTLDELGDILLEVAAAAEKEKKPKVTEQKVVRDTLWGRKRAAESVATNGSAARKRNFAALKPESESQEASNFSQAYEFFVKGFDAKKQKN